MFTAAVLAAAMCGQSFTSASGLIDSMQSERNRRYAAEHGGRMDLGGPPPPERPAKPLSRAKRAAAIRAQQPTRPAPDPVGLAHSRLATARLLIRSGKQEQANGWLSQIIAMNASPATVAEARKLLK